MPRGRPLLRRLQFRHECRRFWCWLEDLNLPPLAYEASALPDELSQRRELPKRDAAPLPVWKRHWSVRRGSAPRPRMDVHDVKERGADGTVVTSV